MTVHINYKVTPFGQIILEIGQPVFQVEAPPILPERREIYYHEPMETVMRIYELQYEETTDYVIPPFTA
jgi:hypothetical protein